MNHEVDVLIIGAGASGIGFAVQLLRQYGTRNFELVEKSDQIGGTWWVNSYPGCGCDVCHPCSDVACSHTRLTNQ